MMRKSILLLTLLLASSLSLLFGIGCDKLTTEVNNNTFFDSTLGQDCLRCHSDNDNKITQPKGQWANSAHASPTLIEAHVTLNGDDFETNTCAPQCHTSEGFIRFTTNGQTTPEPMPSTIDCFTCHMPHSGDYGSWKADTLRGLVSPATLRGDFIYDQGKSNMCVVCHQAAKIPTIPAGTLSIKLDSLGADGPHYSAQAHMLLGQGGFRFGTGTIANSHASVASQGGCLKCHFGTGQGYAFGEHTFRLEAGGQQYTANCEVAGCHVGTLVLNGFYGNPIQDSIRGLTDSLAALLITAHILTGLDADTTEYYKDSTVSADEARILFNYLLHKKDGSQGVHNADYAVRLLDESIQQFNAVPHADFTADNVAGCVPLTVQFTSTSTGTITSQVWHFSETDSSQLANPTYIYNDTGAFSVTLVVRSTGGVDTLIRTNYIMVEDTAAPTFTVSEDTVAAGIPILFTNTSTFGGTYLWDFGDTTTSANPDTVTHAYSTPGDYEVTLSKTTGCGVKTVTDTITVTAVTTSRPSTLSSRR